MKDEVSGDVSPGSISLSNKRFEEELLFPAKTSYFCGPFYHVRGKRRPPGGSRRACFQCGGLVGPDVPLPRQRGANRPCRDRVSAASPCVLGAHAFLRCDHDARALGAAPLRCALLLLLGCVVDVGWRRQVLVWILVILTLSLRAFSHACHQLTVIVLCLTSLTVVARCMHVGALIHAGLGMGIHLVWGMLINVWRYVLIQGVRVRTGTHVWNVVVKFLVKQRLRVRVL